MCGKKEEKEYEIHYYETDERKKALPTAIMNYFCDICMVQSDKAGIGSEYMQENNLAWVLYKWDIYIREYPAYREKIKVTTAAHSFKKFYAYRKFRVEDTSGNIIITANSMWLLIDLNRRRALKLPENMYEAYGIGPDDNKGLEIRKIIPPEEFDSISEFDVRYSDIDTNKHVNNVKYAEWILETVPEEIKTSHVLKNINITYEKETFYGEKIKVCSKSKSCDEQTICSHKILSSSGNLLVIAETVWEKLFF